MLASVLALGLSLALPIACTDKDEDDTGQPGGTTGTIDPGDLTDVAYAVSDVIPTVVTMTWTSGTEGDGWVEYSLGTGSWQATPVQSAGTSHQAVVLGLKAGKTYRLRAVTETADGTRLVSGEGEVELAPAPAELARFELTVDDDGQREGGYILASQLQASDNFMVILDRDGDVVWYYKAPEGLSVPTPIPARDGTSLLFIVNDKDQLEDIGRIIRIAMDGSYSTETRSLTSHHSFVELPGNRFAWIGIEERTVPATWRDDADSTEDIVGEEWFLAGDVIYEIDEGATDADTPTEVFNYFDDYGVDPYWMCRHASAMEYGLESFDWTHGNSLMYVESQDDLYLMAKNMDHVLRIDRDTGQVVYRIGDSERAGDFDDHSDFALGASAGWWSHGHMSHLWEGGMVVFDNGYHHDSSVSRVMAYSWDDETMRLSVDFQYEDPEHRFIQLLGDGRWLDNGNYLTAWTSAGVIAELTPEGEVVWQVEAELGAGVGRVTLLDNLYDLTRAEMH